MYLIFTLSIYIVIDKVLILVGYKFSHVCILHRSKNSSRNELGQPEIIQWYMVVYKIERGNT